MSTITSLGLPDPQVRSPRIHERDGSVLVYVPEGAYTLGTHEMLPGITKEARLWPQPEHRVQLSGYWIGKYPVTNAQYGRFLEATGHWEPRLWDDDQFNGSEQPVVGVTWHDALAYVRWAGLQLPSEAQWEAAARGADRRTYPWGNEPPSAELAHFDGRLGTTSAVGAHPKGAGPFGTLDQAGNIWEWCLDVFDDKAYVDRDGEQNPVNESTGNDENVVRVARGASCFHPAHYLPSAIRDWFPAGDWGHDLGFRVVCRSGAEPGAEKPRNEFRGS